MIIRAIVCIILLTLFCIAVQDAFRKWINPQMGAVLETTAEGIHLPSFTICPFSYPEQDMVDSMSDIFKLPSIKKDMTLFIVG